MAGDFKERQLQVVVSNIFQFFPNLTEHVVVTENFSSLMTRLGIFTLDFDMLILMVMITLDILCIHYAIIFVR